MLLTRLPMVQHAAKVAERVQAAFSAPFVIDEHTIGLTVSMGISLIPYDGEDMDTLLQHAEVALHHAKTLGRNTYRFYSPTMNAAASERLTLENHLIRAVEQEEFQLYFQPQYHLPSASIIGAEALIRWFHPEKGMISPVTFIPVAEETGLITTIGEWAAVRGIRPRVSREKRAELSRVRAELRASARPDSSIPPGRLADLIAYENRLEGINTWLFDRRSLLRFGIIVGGGMSMVGGAVVERLLTGLLGS